MRRITARSAQRSERRRLGLRRLKTRGHKTDRRLDHSGIEITANYYTIGIGTRIDPFQQPAHLILARIVTHARRDQVSDVNVD
jgi:hypothetical protein